MRPYAHLYEINARLLTRRIAKKYRRNLTLASVPEEEWENFARQGFDLVWLMGVWQRSACARREALAHAGLRREYAQALHDWTDDDIIGSPYAVYAYSPDLPLGKKTDLAALKAKLSRLGLALVLDFVPNHLACDHPWVAAHPEWFVQGKERDAAAHPELFFSTDDKTFIAHGRDPNFPPWTDTAQVNYHVPALRRAMIDELLEISAVADGVRCDMAMLVLNDVFERTCGSLLTGYPRPQNEFWTEAIERVKQRRPDFLFLAEVYWGLERKMQELGFDFTYDKHLYDRLRFSTPIDIRQYIMSNDTHHRCVHFIENHDEERALTALGRERSLAAAVVVSTLPGLRLFHDGQLEGRRIRLPVQLIREPEEPEDAEVKSFYSRLLEICNAPAFHDGNWEMMELSPAWDGNNSYSNLLAWCWRLGERFKMVVVNYSPCSSQGRLKMPVRFGAARVEFRDELTRAVYPRDAAELNSPGLYIDLAPWKSHILDVTL